MPPTSVPITMYGAAATQPAPDWTWVDDQLAGAGTYWVVARSGGWPHPRPVWGVWADETLYLSIGSPIVTRQLHDDPTVTVHLDSGTDVVVVEGRRTGERRDAAVIAAYDRKYDWRYDVDEYGPLAVVTPVVVLAWRSAGWAGREGFQSAGRWTF